MPKILIIGATQNVEELLVAIKNIEPDCEVKSTEAQAERQIRCAIASHRIFFEALSIWVTAEVGKVVIKKVTEAAIAWAKQRLEKRGDNSLPQLITIFGSEGIPLVAKIVASDEEVRDVTEGMKDLFKSMPVHLL